MKRQAVFPVIMVMGLVMSGAFSLVLGASIPKEANIAVTNEEFMVNKHVARVLEVSDGGILTVVLGSIPATGFSWPRAAEIGNGTILQQSDNKLLIPEARSIIGSPGSHVWTFRALQKGTTTIYMEYSQPWEGGVKAERTFELTVHVK